MIVAQNQAIDGLGPIGSSSSKFISAHVAVAKSATTMYSQADLRQMLYTVTQPPSMSLALSGIDVNDQEAPYVSTLYLLFAGKINSLPLSLLLTSLSP